MLRVIPRGAHCAEIGVQRGLFAQEIIRIVKPARLHLVDLWAFQPSGYDDIANQNEQQHREALEECRSRFLPDSPVKFHRGSSVKISAEFDQSVLDFVYIDANHAYANVLSDMCMWWPIVEEGGFLAGHDFESSSHPDVSRAVTDFCRIFEVPLFGSTVKCPGELERSWIIRKPGI